MSTSTVTFDLSDLSPAFYGTIKIWASEPITNGKYQGAPPFEQTILYNGEPVQVELTTQEPGESWYYICHFYPTVNGRMSTQGATQARFYLPSGTASATYAWTGSPNNSTSTKTVGGVLTETNLIANPSFEVNNAGWTPVGVTLTTPAESPVNGIKSAKAVTTGVSSTTGDIRLSTGGSAVMAPNIQVGKTYTVTAYITIPQAHVASNTASDSRQRRILFFAYTPSVNPIFGPQAPNVAGRHRLTHTFTVPANATGCILAIGCAGSGSDPAFTTYVDSVMLQEGSVVRGYFDGDTVDTSTNNLTDLMELYPAW